MSWGGKRVEQKVARGQWRVNGGNEEWESFVAVGRQDAEVEILRLSLSDSLRMTGCGLRDELGDKTDGSKRDFSLSSE